MLLWLNKPDEAISSIDQAISLYGASEELRMQGVMASAHQNRGGALVQLGRLDESITEYGNIINRFGAPTDVNIQASVANA